MPVSKELRKAITAMGHATVWLSAAATALALDGSVSETAEVDEMANQAGVMLKKLKKLKNRGG
jgi:hypothetical protein